MDHSIGQILDHLDAKGLAEDTLLVFTSDLGHLFGRQGMTAEAPFHYEDLVKFPFVARVPGAPVSRDGSPALQASSTSRKTPNERHNLWEDPAHTPLLRITRRDDFSYQIFPTISFLKPSGSTCRRHAL